MRKLLILLALVATPAVAQNLTISTESYDKFFQGEAEICRAASYGPSNEYAKRVLILSGVSDPSEKLLILAMCRAYIRGRLDQLNA